jgi:hypothetical protein
MFGVMIYRVFAALLFASSFGGCYNRTTVAPTELPRLNGMSSQTHGYGRLTVITETVQNVRRTDGRVVQIQGAFAAEVIPHDDRLGTVRFEHPVEARVDQHTLYVAGANRAELEFALGDVSHVDVVSSDTGATLAAIIVAIAASAAALGGLIMVGIVSD